jgi:hypothetical protein
MSHSGKEPEYKRVFEASAFYAPLVQAAKLALASGFGFAPEAYLEYFEHASITVRVRKDGTPQGKVKINADLVILHWETDPFRITFAAHAEAPTHCLFDVDGASLGLSHGWDMASLLYHSQYEVRFLVIQILTKHLGALWKAYLLSTYLRVVPRIQVVGSTTSDRSQIALLFHTSRKGPDFGVRYLMLSVVLGTQRYRITDAHVVTHNGTGPVYNCIGLLART